MEVFGLKKNRAMILGTIGSVFALFMGLTIAPRLIEPQYDFNGVAYGQRYSDSPGMKVDYTWENGYVGAVRESDNATFLGEGVDMIGYVFGKNERFLMGLVMAKGEARTEALYGALVRHYGKGNMSAEKGKMRYVWKKVPTLMVYDYIPATKTGTFYYMDMRKVLLLYWSGFYR